ncbi:hypothetical protein [Methylophilus sp. TWE2]|uniref:hypothetical protein n=1 Tax=Methylophilus sp. TWE2 TaxID=1662285 RepID=UPI0006708F9E|nr:hypothetical protein [Methylophilus sp. TWE2]AKR43976.1 hypothetical protein ACJ67_11560 [Methylophilus sp. TWE2]
MHQKTFVAKDGQVYLIRIDDTGEEILVLREEDPLGVIDLKRLHETKGAESFLVSVLDLEKCKRIGIGEAALCYHKEVFHKPLRANGNVREGRQSGENLMTREGIAFIGNMRRKGVIELIDFHDAFSEDE